ncbi:MULTISPECIES: helix-turn-helix domain-containing protein [Streptococcaceae]|uniref:helix-turn-helix domain-containing protein n=1 Tax=Streptococcaceae TaxID=1300 RepID=UPI001EF80D89|nr:MULTISPECIES: helix-turn-helix domain-containing protein [Streptococcaceae]MDV2595415.1 helix-turn-helix domain-containing protein [Streptococcus infantarius]
MAEHFGVTNRSQVQHWVKLYENNPQLLYQDNRGRPAQVKSETMTLEEQVNYLKMEVAILKKLRKLL